MRTEMRVGGGWNCVENARGRQDENALAFDGVILISHLDLSSSRMRGTIIS